MNLRASDSDSIVKGFDAGGLGKVIVLLRGVVGRDGGWISGKLAGREQLTRFIPDVRGFCNPCIGAYYNLLLSPLLWLGLVSGRGRFSEGRARRRGSKI